MEELNVSNFILKILIHPCWYSSLLILMGSQNHSHTWFVMGFVLYVFIVAFRGISKEENPEMKPKVRFVHWQVVSHCSSNERNFHMHWSHLNIFLGIIEHITPKKPKLHTKWRLRSIDVQNTVQCDHLPFGQPYLLPWIRFWVTYTNNVCDVCRHLCTHYVTYFV